MTPKLIADVMVEPVTLEECRDYLGLQVVVESDGHPDDAKIEIMMKAAREICEQFTGLAFARKTYEIAMPSFPTGVIELPGAPVVLVEYITVAGAAIDPDEYVVDTYSKPGTVGPVTDWPSITTATNTVVVRYQTGYGVDSDGGEELPAVVKSAILLTVGNLYDGVDKLADIPMAVDVILRPLRINLGGA
jgi:uncharacterized phiE125 gp8 family phage protein